MFFIIFDPRESEEQFLPCCCAFARGGELSRRLGTVDVRSTYALTHHSLLELIWLSALFYANPMKRRALAAVSAATTTVCSVDGTEYPF